MTQPYDVMALLVALKARGLNVVEDSVKALVEETLAWVESSAKLSATPFDDIAVIVLPQLKRVALQEIDKIDGAVG